MIDLLITKLLEWFLELGYWGLFLSSLGIFPTEILITVLASMEENNIWLIALVTAFGETIGAYPIFFLGKMFTGENIYTWIEGKGKLLGIDNKKFEESKTNLVKRSYYYVALSRFVPWIRVAVSLAAGFLRLRILPFSISIFLGVFFYSFGFAYFGYKVGGDWEIIKKYISIGDKWLIALVILFIVTNLSWKNRRKFHKWLKQIKKQFRK
jgi:membrane protein DedA with SNARE-associated domain